MATNEKVDVVIVGAGASGSVYAATLAKAGKKVVIFKGEGGRDWLADTLHEAGASVVGISTYARVPLSPQHVAWQALKEKEIDFSQSLWLLTSSEAVRYLGQVLQEQGLPSLQTASAMCTTPTVCRFAVKALIWLECAMPGPPTC